MAEAGSVTAFARDIQRPEQTFKRLMDGGTVRSATADDYHRILRALGFVGPTGLEPRTLHVAPVAENPCTPSDPPPRAA